jgi:hypothetical protein
LVVHRRAWKQIIGCWKGNELGKKWVMAFVKALSQNTSRGSAVDMATRYGLDEQRVGVRVPVRVNNFHFFLSSRPALGSTHPPIQLVPGGLFPRG